MPNRPLTLVLGMHRSGTSLCANILSALGIDMAEAPGASPDNRKGHWERPRINDLNDQVFAVFGRSWSDPTHHLALPDSWQDDRRTYAIRDEIVQYLAPRLSQSRAFGLKDPRIARLLPMWRDIFLQLGADPVFVFCVRDPAQVARSVTARDHLARDQAEYRWLIYNAHAVHGVGGARVCVIPYENWFTAPEATLHRLARFVVPGAITAAHPALSIVDTALRHDDANTLYPAKPVIQRLHRLIAQSAEDDRFGVELRRLAANIVEMEQATAALLLEAAIAQVSIAKQNRVIADLNALIQKLRTENNFPGAHYPVTLPERGPRRPLPS